MLLVHATNFHNGYKAECNQLALTEICFLVQLVLGEPHTASSMTISMIDNSFDQVLDE